MTLDTSDWIHGPWGLLWPGCCCDQQQGGACTCQECDGGDAPCCWTVAITGLAKGTCDTCDAPQTFNKTWALKQVEPGSCTWTCSMPDSCTDCGTITCTLTVSGGEIVVVCAGVTWRKTTTDCSSSHTLTYDSSDGTCNGAGASCVVTPHAAASPCECTCPVICPACKTTLVASLVEVVISGLINNDGSVSPYYYGCTGCNVANGTFTLSYLDCTVGCNTLTSAIWYYSNTGLDICNAASTCDGLSIRAGLGYKALTDQKMVWVEIGWNSCSGGMNECNFIKWRKVWTDPEAWDCTGESDYTVTFTADDLYGDSTYLYRVDCDATEVTVTFTIL